MPEKITEAGKQDGRRLKLARIAAGFDQGDVSTSLAVQQMTVSRWERGASPVPDHKRAALARLLRTTEEAIWGTMHGVTSQTPIAPAHGSLALAQRLMAISGELSELAQSLLADAQAPVVTRRPSAGARPLRTAPTAVRGSKRG